VSLPPEAIEHVKVLRAIPPGVATNYWPTSAERHAIDALIGGCVR
jgi:hypothetical protein